MRHSPALFLRLTAALAGVALVVIPAVSASRPHTYTITIRQMAFGPTPSTLRVGDTIVWDNEDLFVHSATATDKSFDVELKPKARATVVLRRPGTIAFVCRYHPGMKGRLVVAK
jgi:plastocyanin